MKDHESDPVHVVFWNRDQRRRPARSLDLLYADTEWDVALLVECTERFIKDARDLFGTEEVQSSLDRHRPDQAKPTGCAIIVRPEATVRSPELLFPPTAQHDAPRPERALTAEVTIRGSTFRVAAVHVMNTADGYSRKMRTYELLSTFAGDERHWPLVIGMDGNHGGDTGAPARRRRQRPSGRDFAAQAEFHSPGAPHRMIDSFRTMVERDPARMRAAESHLAQWHCLAATYRRIGALDRMDRIYVSPDIGVVAAGIQADAMEVSDHALVWATITPGDPNPQPVPAAETDPVIEPRSRRPPTARARVPDTLCDVADALITGYGWNRQGYLARVLLANANGHPATKDFIEAHYPDTARPSSQWNGAKVSLNRSWTLLGGERLGASPLINYDSSSGSHTVATALAQDLTCCLGISDLVGRDDDALEDELHARIRGS